ncbi:GTP-binding protein [Gemmiger sp.]|uniref:GTP-binding protein n=1 Tax=Gemmiger sp. TaxID=2049027 RepID=UPI00342E1D41
MPPSTAAAAVRPAAKSSTSTSIGPLVRPTFWSWASRASSSNRISRPSSPPPACGHVLRAKGFVQDENGWVELNATADGLTANAIPKGQEVLIVIGEGLEKERIEVRLKG